MDPFEITISREIDLSQILAMVACTATAIGFVVRSYGRLHDKDAKHDAEIAEIRQWIKHQGEIHERDLASIVKRIDEGFHRVENAISEIISRELKR